MISSRVLYGIAVTVMFTLSPASANAEEASAYPSKSIIFTVGYQPGGATDLAARIVAAPLAAALGKPVVVENRPGAGSNIAGARVAKAAPDGYTLFVAAGGLATNPSLYASMGYDPVKDLAPVIELVSLPNLIVVNPQVPIKGLTELIAYAKANPDKLNCASSNPGSIGHLTCELLGQQTGAKMVQVQFKGSAEAVTALLGGHVEVMIGQIPATLSHIKEGKLRALAVTTSKRNPNLPEVPTVDESGLPGFYSNTWLGIFAPTGTPPDVIAKLNKSIDHILTDPAIQEKLESLGMDPVGGTSGNMEKVLREDTAKWKAVIDKAGIKLH